MTNSSDSRFHLIWADKVALGLTLLFVAIAALFWGFAILATGIAGAEHIGESFGFAALIDVAFWLIALWLVMRTLDFAVRLAGRYMSSGNHSIASADRAGPAHEYDLLGRNF